MVGRISCEGERKENMNRRSEERGKYKLCQRVLHNFLGCSLNSWLCCIKENGNRSKTWEGRKEENDTAMKKRIQEQDECVT